jgi:short-subunit dehydrogenase
MPTNKCALITGATSGIGYELAKLFARDGYNLVIVARKEDELQHTANTLEQAYQVKVTTISKDLFAREAPFELYQEVKQKDIQIDVLVNDAGQGLYGEFVETDINRELDIIQLNIGAYVVLTKYYLREMVARNEGKILNVASIAGKMPGPLQAVYHATKAFVLSFSAAVREEIKETNVTITDLLPGATDTDFFHKTDMEDAKMVREGKLADPAEVAADGYKALMDGENKVISGIRNKIQTTMSNIMPDSQVAANMHEQMKPSSDEEQK